MVHPALRIDCAVSWSVTFNDDALGIYFSFSVSHIVLQWN
jgi:hypothetical protein